MPKITFTSHMHPQTSHSLLHSLLVCGWWGWLLQECFFLVWVFCFCFVFQLQWEIFFFILVWVMVILVYLICFCMREDFVVSVIFLGGGGWEVNDMFGSLDRCLFDLSDSRGCIFRKYYHRGWTTLFNDNEILGQFCPFWVSKNGIKLNSFPSRYSIYLSSFHYPHGNNFLGVCIYDHLNIQTGKRNSAVSRETWTLKWWTGVLPVIFQWGGSVTQFTEDSTHISL